MDEMNNVTVVEMNSDGTNTVSSVPAEEFDSYEVTTSDSKVGIGTVALGIAAIVGIAATAKYCYRKVGKVVETYKAGKYMLAEHDTEDDPSEEIEEDSVTNFVNKRKEEKEGK